MNPSRDCNICTIRAGNLAKEYPASVNQGKQRHLAASLRPMALQNLPLRMPSGPLAFWGNAGAFGKADDAFLSRRREG